MATAGIRDILIANQVVGAEKMARLAELRQRADPIGAVDSTVHTSRRWPTRGGARALRSASSSR